MAKKVLKTKKDSEGNQVFVSTRAKSKTLKDVAGITPQRKARTGVGVELLPSAKQRIGKKMGGK